MPQSVGDFLKFIIISEQDGVQMSNALYWQIDDLGSDPTLTVGLNDLLTDYHAQVTAFVAPTWKVVCGILINLTDGGNKAVVFTTLAGTALGKAHAQDQVLRMNQYAKSPGPPTVRRGAFNQSGVEEPESVRGRWRDLDVFDAFRLWLVSSALVLGAGWTLQAQLRSRLTVGPPPTFQFTNMHGCQPASRVFKLGSRKTSLCAQT